MFVCRQKWSFFKDTFLEIFPTNFFTYFPASCSTYVLYSPQVSCLWNLPSWGSQELDLGHQVANEELEPFVVYESFLKIFLRISFKRFLLVALYTSSVLTKFHLFENSLAGVPGSSNLSTGLNIIVCRQKRPFFYDTFLKISPTNFIKNYPTSCYTYVLYTH